MSQNTVAPPNVTIYTGSICLGNPGPGGCAVILEYKMPQKTAEQEISYAFEKTTGNRMKIMAIIVGLEALKTPCRVTVWSDSDYLVEALNKGCLRERQQSDKKTDIIKEAYADLWDRLWVLCTTNQVKFEWVDKHSNNKKIARCGELAKQDLKNIQLTQSVPINPTRRVIRKQPTFFEVDRKTVKAGLCPICGGLGYRMVKAAPHSNHPTIKIKCTQCLGTKYLKQNPLS
jgi:ribonuclease HI